MPPILVLFALIFAQPAEVETRMIALSDANHVSSRCGGPFPACTHFVGPQLNADCASPMGGAFSIRANPRYTVLIYLASGDYVRHEYLHVKDVERAVSAHVARLGKGEFEDRAECERAAAAAAASFATALRTFAAASNAERH